MAPPGKAGWPACSRRSALRWMNSRSGSSSRCPVRRPAANRTSTAEARPPRAGGWACGLISILLAASASSRSQSGTGSPSGHENGPALTSLAAISGSVGPSPYDGHRRASAARAAGRPAGVADPAAVPDHALREVRPVPARDERGHLGLDLHRVGVGRPVKPAGQPPEVGVHGDAGDAEGVAEHHVGGLAADAGQGDQILQPARDLAAEPIAQGLAESRSGCWPWRGRTRSTG